MNRKEFNIKASILNVWGFLLLMFISLNIALLIGSIVITYNMVARVILMGAICQVVVYIGAYLTKFDLKIILDASNVYIYKNNKLLHSKAIVEIEKLVGGDILDDEKNMGQLSFVFCDGNKFSFSNKLSTRSKNLEQSFLVKSIVRYFIKEYDFIQQDHYTKLGKSKYLFVYSNSKYIKDE
ncbi:hypothetical protein [Myroides sp. N17-2]|uniref:hypothetical protein n=1 Tax=Myroides sp. N17-2 TaxID=2030799 RepID=UPI000EFD2D77|nr:hypothetical protein [Myroides sp. N17-2]